MPVSSLYVMSEVIIRLGERVPFFAFIDQCLSFALFVWCVCAIRQLRDLCFVRLLYCRYVNNFINIVVAWTHNVRLYKMRNVHMPHGIFSPAKCPNVTVQKQYTAFVKFVIYYLPPPTSSLKCLPFSFDIPE